MSGQYVMGKNVLNFEKKFANYFGSKHAVMVNSGLISKLVDAIFDKIFSKVFKKNTKIQI